MVSIESVDEMLSLWAPRLRPKRFKILGGEPTLHPQFPEFVETCAKYFRKAQRAVTSNGALLHKHPRLPEVLAKHNISLFVSFYGDVPDLCGNADSYNKQWSKIAVLLKEWSAKYPKFRYSVRKQSKIWWFAYREKDKNIESYNSGDATAAYKACCTKSCYQLFNNRLFPCPLVAYARLPEVACRLQGDWGYFLNFEGLPHDCSDSDLQQLVKCNRGSWCSLCPSRLDKLAATK